MRGIFVSAVFCITFIGIYGHVFGQCSEMDYRSKECKIHKKIDKDLVKGVRKLLHQCSKKYQDAVITMLPNAMDVYNKTPSKDLFMLVEKDHKKFIVDVHLNKVSNLVFDSVSLMFPATIGVPGNYYNYLVQNNGKWGMINVNPKHSSERILLTCVFDSIVLYKGQLEIEQGVELESLGDVGKKRILIGAKKGKYKLIFLDVNGNLKNSVWLSKPPQNILISDPSVERDTLVPYRVDVSTEDSEFMFYWNLWNNSTIELLPKEISFKPFTLMMDRELFHMGNGGHKYGGIFVSRNKEVLELTVLEIKNNKVGFNLFNDKSFTIYYNALLWTKTDSTSYKEIGSFECVSYTEHRDQHILGPATITSTYTFDGVYFDSISELMKTMLEGAKCK